jgi:hypothetical protein
VRCGSQTGENIGDTQTSTVDWAKAHNTHSGSMTFQIEMLGWEHVRFEAVGRFEGRQRGEPGRASDPWREPRQLFHAIDPSSFRERDLDPSAEAFIVEWARMLPRHARLALLVHLERRAGQEIRPSRDASPRVIRRRRIRVSTAMRHSNVNGRTTVGRTRQGSMCEAVRR